MSFTSFQSVLWAAGLLGHVALLLVLLTRGGARSFPFFTGWIGFQIAETLALFALHRSGQDDLYYDVYWYAHIPELLLVLGIAFEVARHVLRASGEWSWGVRTPFTAFAAAAVVIAFFMAIALHPELPTTSLGWLYPSKLFCSALIFELGLAVMLTAHQFGLAWRNRVMGLAQGWIGWSGVSFAAEAVRSYFPQSQIGPLLVQLRMYAYLAAVVLWTVTFWRPEPARRPMTSGMRALFSSNFAELSTDEKMRELE